MTVALVNANTMTIPLADQSVHCVISSPPYWGLRDYGLATWEGGDAGCDHKIPLRPIAPRYDGKSGQTWRQEDEANKSHTCAKCGAIRHDVGIGLEETPDEYIANMVQVGREIWRVLRDDGTMWLNLGDSYASRLGGSHGGWNGEHDESFGRRPGAKTSQRVMNDNVNRARPPSLKPKDLVGIPWRVALALQADGWYLRSDIIWSKPNPMPESVTDRPTKAHEYVFLLTKRPRYFYDSDAIRESNTEKNPRKSGTMGRVKGNDGISQPDWLNSPTRYDPTNGRNKRTVWSISTQSFSGAHFATFPEALVEPMIKAGTSEHGVCPECGAAWKRVVKRHFVAGRKSGPGNRGALGDVSPTSTFHTDGVNMPITTGFAPTCAHSHDPVPAIILDPFCGSGTTGVVARRLGRHFVGLDLSPGYLQLARTRLGLTALDDWNRGRGRVMTDDVDGLPLFDSS